MSFQFLKRNQQVPASMTNSLRAAVNHELKSPLFIASERIIKTKLIRKVNTWTAYSDRKHLGF